MLSADRLHLRQLSPLPPADICKGLLSKAGTNLTAGRQISLCVLTLLLPWFGLASAAASAAAVLAGLPVHLRPPCGWSQTLHNTNLPLGGAIKSAGRALKQQWPSDFVCQ